MVSEGVMGRAMANHMDEIPQWYVKSLHSLLLGLGLSNSQGLWGFHIIDLDSTTV